MWAEKLPGKYLRVTHSGIDGLYHSGWWGVGLTSELFSRRSCREHARIVWMDELWYRLLLRPY